VPSGPVAIPARPPWISAPRGPTLATTWRPAMASPFGPFTPIPCDPLAWMFPLGPTSRLSTFELWLYTISEVVMSSRDAFRIPRRIDESFHSARLAMWRGDLAQALDIADRGLALTQSSSENAWRLRLLRAEILLAKPDLPQALPTLSQPIPEGASFAALRGRQEYLVARSQVLQGRLAEALTTLDKAAREAPEDRELRLDAELPLTLVSPANVRTINSIFGDVEGPSPLVHLHPADADARGLVDGQDVTVMGTNGSLDTSVAIDDDLRPGVASMPKGLWRRAVGGGLTANAFAPDTLNDLAGGACFNDARVDVRAR